MPLLARVESQNRVGILRDRVDRRRGGPRFGASFFMYMRLALPFVMGPGNAERASVAEIVRVLFILMPIVIILSAVSILPGAYLPHFHI
jgi:hypothetical protein